MLEVVLYSPGKGSSFGQAARYGRVRPAFDAVQHFLARCAIANPIDHIRLVAYRATQWDDDHVAEACIARTVAHFGPPDQIEGGGTHWPYGNPVKGGSFQWAGSLTSLESMVDYLDSGEPWPKQTLRPVELKFSVYFQWLDPRSSEIRPGQRAGHATPDGSLRSNLLVTLGRRPFVQPDLWFPFPEGSSGISEFLRAVEPYLPFDLLPRYFRVATSKRDGTGFRFRKPVIPPLIAVNGRLTEY